MTKVTVPQQLISLDTTVQWNACSPFPPFLFFSPLSLFTSFDETIWDKETPFLLRELFDNYDPDVTVVEDNTLQEQAEVCVCVGGGDLRTLG